MKYGGLKIRVSVVRSRPWAPKSAILWIYHKAFAALAFANGENHGVKAQ
jgi:hypothetical protein